MELFRRWGSARTVLTWRRGRRVRARLWAVEKDADVQADVQVDVQALYKCLRAFSRDWRMHKLRAHGGRAAQGGWEGYQPNFARRANVSITYYKCPLWPLTPLPPITIQNQALGIICPVGAGAHAHRERPFPPASGPGNALGALRLISARDGSCRNYPILANRPRSDFNGAHPKMGVGLGRSSGQQHGLRAGTPAFPEEWPQI